MVVVVATLGLASHTGLDFAAPPSILSPVSSVVSPPRNCSEARARGMAPMTRWHPGYAAHLDADGDGIACETYLGR